MTNLSLTSHCPETRGQSVVGIRVQPGSEVCGWIRGQSIAGVSLWLRSKVSLWPGQESVYGLAQGSDCDRDSVSLCSNQDSIHHQGQRPDGPRSGFGHGQSWECRSVEERLPTELHWAKV